MHGQTSFWIEVIYLQHLLIEYLAKCNFLKIADTISIFVASAFFCWREIICVRKTGPMNLTLFFCLPLSIPICLFAMQDLRIGSVFFPDFFFCMKLDSQSMKNGKTWFWKRSWSLQGRKSLKWPKNKVFGFLTKI